MVSQDRVKQERLLNFAGWLHHKHRFQTLPHGSAHTEVTFTREDLGDVPALSAYGLDKGDAGEQALHRDLSALRSFGIEVECDPVKKAWVSRAAPLNDAECRALATAALHVLVEDGSVGPDGYHIPGAGLSPEGAEVIVAYAPITDLLVAAIRTRRPVSILHRGSSREVDPWHVLMADGRWYLVGRDHTADARRVFALDAIDSADFSGPEGSIAIPNEDFELLSRTIAAPDKWTSSTPVEVHLDVHPRLVNRAEALLGAVRGGTSTSSGWVSMTCTVQNINSFITRLWGLRSRAVVTGPDQVRSRVVTALKEMG